jgi:predicted transposase YdaD
MSNGEAMVNHDHGFEVLFSHSEMMAGFLRDFVQEEWFQHLDFTTLERVAGSFVTPDLLGRESDVVWRVRWARDRWLYIYLLIEFQSTADPFIALRMMVHMGLLHQDLVRRQELTSSGRLPPILPLLLYGEGSPQGVAQEVSELIEEGPCGLERYPPRLRWSMDDMWDESLWRQDRRQKGRQEARQEDLEKARGVIIKNLEGRFGPLPEDIRRRVEGIASFEELTELSIRAGAASSLAALYP